ncbi:heavy metal-responsive transcriptional regulator [Mycobacterium intracellulare]|uniref:heavy metal-responsive transcriptional regulator n=1 Tax=Mycobacterium intracellulare TaxID=1767 RepID=UPI0006CA6545|nr:heavy metal-responsive transcriptional regulator [Mycobacterium intracellulare]KPN45930.1 MerR family transcriptional regulator [Mycobacterium intracellulare subsp. chimaera]
MRIGQLAAATGLSTKTIRYYEDVGLLSAPPRAPSGYRDYRDDAVARLRFVRAAQSVGFSLGEIREVLAFRDRGQEPCAHVRQLIEQHAADLADRIAALTTMRDDLERLAQRARAISATAATDAVFCHIIES